MLEHNELFQKILMLSELELKGQASPSEKKFLEDHCEIHLFVLKHQKSQVEYQFTSHKATMSQYYSDLCNKKIVLEKYTELRKEQFLWKARATSYLFAIEQKMNLLKSKKKHAK